MSIERAAGTVFGGASGLGDARARRLAAEGLCVVVADINGAGAAAVAEQIDGESIACDVSRPDEVAAAVERARTRAGRGLRVAVCCAGLATPAKLVGRDGPTPLDKFRRVIEVNLLGTINVLRLSAGAMLANAPDDGGKRGVLVATASIAAYDGQIGQVAYSESKAGIVGLTTRLVRYPTARRSTRVCEGGPGQRHAVSKAARGPT